MRLVDVLALGGALVVGSLTGGGCSCSDDDGGLPDSGADAQSDAPTDGAVSGTRNGTLALTQFTVADTAAQGAQLAGLSVAASFDDLTTATVAPAYTDGAAGCTVFRYTVATDSEPAEVDEGPISVTGFGPYGDFTCAFNDAAGRYFCSSDDAAASGTVAAGSGTSDPQGALGFVNVTINNVDMTTLNPRGMVVTFPDGTWDDPSQDGTFPIVNYDPVAAVDVVTTSNLGSKGASVAMNNTYTTLIGEGPVPGFPDADAVLQPFDALDGAAAFGVAGGGADGGAIDAFDEQITPATLAAADDHALVLADDSMTTTAFPTTAAKTKVSCDAAQNGNCENGGVLNALIVSGETTDATLPTGGPNPIADATAMPDPVTEYATFTCVFLGQKSGNIPAAAITEILGTSPTRIETRVIYASGKILGEADGDVTNILSGYGLVGHTDM